MNTDTVLLICAALIPAIILCLYIFIKDRAEKEPPLLLLGLFVLGAIAAFPAAEIESVAFDLIYRIFSPLMHESDGAVVMSSSSLKLYNFTKYFFGVALVEEGFKWLAMYLTTRRNKNFNSLFDGVIYSVFVSLGFAAIENVLYALDYGWSTALVRAFTAVPGHMFFGVMMGYHYSVWHIYKKAGKLEQLLIFNEIITQKGSPVSGGIHLFLSLAVPVFIHGFYDYCLSSDSLLSTLVFVLFLVFLYFFCFRQIRKMSKSDAKDMRFANGIIVKKYPDLADSLEGLTADLGDLRPY